MNIKIAHYALLLSTSILSVCGPALKAISPEAVSQTTPIDTTANQEIEVKFSIADADYALLTEWLSKNAQSKGQLKHQEWYFDNPTNSFKFSQDGYVDSLTTVRVRSTNKGSFFCVKVIHRDPATGMTLYRDEYETKIGDAETVCAGLNKLGFTEVTEVKKTRQVYLYEAFEIVLDDVENVGKFIEIELKKSAPTPQKGIQEIYALIKSIGITEITAYDHSYIHMKWNPTVNFGHTRNL